MKVYKSITYYRVTHFLLVKSSKQHQLLIKELLFFCKYETTDKISKFVNQ